MSNVHPIHPEKATPQQILAQAYAQAQAGEIRDVLVKPAVTPLREAAE